MFGEVKCVQITVVANGYILHAKYRGQHPDDRKILTDGPAWVARNLKEAAGIMDGLLTGGEDEIVGSQDSDQD